ncbi:MAG: MiaB/RimO family radical SAM methylthiotransferase, partial [bacterium]
SCSSPNASRFASPVSHSSSHVSRFSSLVTIMRGCSHSCSYCVVPGVRGPAVCRPPDEILKEASEKTLAGASEIVLLGQTVNSYRYFPQNGAAAVTFPDLLKKVCSLEKVKRLRFMSPHPVYIDESLAGTIAAEPKIARHVHLPAQSGSDRILTLMRRGYTRAGFLDRISMMREAAGDVVISTDFIVGFPSETREDLRQTLSLISEAGFSSAYCFKYSGRPGTASAAFPEKVSPGEAGERLGLLLDAVRQSAVKTALARKGTTEEVLLETSLSGRTSSNLWVKFDEEGTPGTLVKAEITGVKQSSLTGRIIK